MSDDSEWGPWIEHNSGECPIPEVQSPNFEIKWIGDGVLSYKSLLAVDVEGWNEGFITAYRVRQQSDMLARAIEALRRADMFITNGVENGYIRLPSPPDPALETPSLIRSILAAYDKRGK